MFMYEMDYCSALGAVQHRAHASNEFACMFAKIVTALCCSRCSLFLVLSRVQAGQRGCLPVSGWPAVHIQSRGSADRHVPLQVPPDEADPHVQGPEAPHLLQVGEATVEVYYTTLNVRLG